LPDLNAFCAAKFMADIEACSVRYYPLRSLTREFFWVTAFLNDCTSAGCFRSNCGNIINMFLPGFKNRTIKARKSKRNLERTIFIYILDSVVMNEDREIR
jgi:hypothetical protein